MNNVILIRDGIERARYDWVYLLDTDTRITGETLTRLLPYRCRGIFAIASRVLSEEGVTGWTDFQIFDGRTHLMDHVIDRNGIMRGHLYARVGSSLFRRQLLQKLINRRPVYRDLTAEAAEWGFRAWREGYEVLFCPTSIVHSSASIELSWQDGYLLTLRQTLELVPRQSIEEMIVFILEKYPEIVSKRYCLDIIDPRGLFAPYRAMSVKYLRRKYYPTPTNDKPYLLFVSPFNIYPPSHGGAIRMTRLLKVISREFQVVVLSDEEGLYKEASVAYFSSLHAIHAIGDRPIERPNSPAPRIERIRTHSHRLLQTELQRLITCYNPQVVQIEYGELVNLIRSGKRDRSWVLTLHDVLLSEERFTLEDRFELSAIRRYDEVLVCSLEDAALLNPIRSRLVPNGFEKGKHPYVSSAGSHLILFAGPFRYSPNWSGIQQFLKTVYPKLQEIIPDVEIAILGGHNAPKMAENISCFQQSGIQVLDYIEDVTPWLNRCAVTINPLYGARGSSLKLIESLAAGRICVSTINGARGFLQAGLPSLIAVERIEDFIEPLEKLLLNESYRLTQEKPLEELLKPFTWTAIGERLLDILHRKTHSL